jgi:hypothetical protein
MKVDIKNSGIQQVKKISIDTFDTWSLDNTLALIILPALLQYKQGGRCGCPPAFMQDVRGSPYDTQYSFDFCTDTYAEAEQAAQDGWIKVVDKMIWSFMQLVKDDYESQYHHNVDDFKVDCDILSCIPSMHGDTHEENKTVRYWYDTVGAQLHDARIQEGLELFGLWYQNLWE